MCRYYIIVSRTWINFYIFGRNFFSPISKCICAKSRWSGGLFFLNFRTTNLISVSPGISVKSKKYICYSKPSLTLISLKFRNSVTQSMNSIISSFHVYRVLHLMVRASKVCGEGGDMPP